MKQNIEACLREHEGKIRALARTRSGRAADFDDLMQEGRLALVRAAEQFDESRGVPFWGYASVVVKRAMHDFCKRAQREPSRPGEVDVDELTSEAVEALEPLVGKRTRRRLVLAMMSLQDEERTILVLRFDRDLSMRDLSMLLGVSLDTVHKRVTRAIENLRKAA